MNIHSILLLVYYYNSYINDLSYSNNNRNINSEVLK